MPRDDMAHHHAMIERLNQQIMAKAERGDTLARAIERLGDQHPLVRQRDSAVRAYRRAMPWQSGMVRGAGR